MNKRNSILKAIITVSLLTAVGAAIYIIFADDKEPSKTSSVTDPVEQTQAELPLNLNFTNLEPLEAGKYEAWIVRGESNFSLGKFNTTVGKNLKGDLSLGDVEPQNGDSLVISIEPDPDTSPEPSGTVILSGDFIDGFATLGFPIDFSGYSGEYILGTPTDDPDGNENAGIWFTSTGTNALLNIPDAPTGWSYEGWVVYKDDYYTSGQFLSPSGVDEFNGYSGSVPGPNYPGEDYISGLPNGVEGPLVLNDGTSKIVVSLEPRVNLTDPTGTGPSQFQFLSVTIGEGVGDHTRFGLNLDPAVPTGSADL